MSIQIRLYSSFVFAVAVTVPPATVQGQVGFAGPQVSDSSSRYPGSITPPTGSTAPQHLPEAPVFMISGKVMLSDGAPLYERVMIQRICPGSSPQIIGYTDLKGRFSIDLGSPAGVFFDVASSPERVGAGRPGRPWAWAGCQVRVHLPGFRSDVVELAGRHPLDNPEVGTIMLHGLAHGEGSTISATTALAPTAARKAFDKAVERAAKSKLDETQKLLEKAVNIYPRYAIAWFQLGRLRVFRGDIEGGKSAFERAIAADPKFLYPHIELAKLDASSQDWTEVVRITDQVVRMNPVDLPEAWLLNGMANVALHRIDEAERDAEELIRLEVAKTNPKADQVVALVHAQRGRWSQAAEFLRRYVARLKPGPDRELASRQLANAERHAAQNQMPGR